MNNKTKLSLGALLVAISAQSMAAVPTEATTAIAAIQTDGLEIIGLAWPVLAAITGGFIVMKLFKKVVNKAS